MPHKYITDLGQGITLRDTKTGQETTLHRYGVWAWDEGKSKYQVIDTGDDPEQLKRKHDIASEIITVQPR